MRFHKFERASGEGDVWIDLDQIAGMHSVGDIGTKLLGSFSTFTIKTPLEDVLALVSPPAAPDNHAHKVAAWLAAPDSKVVETDAMQNTADLKLPPVSMAVCESLLKQGQRRARLHELDRLEAWWRNGERVEGLAAYIDRRRSEL